MSKPTALRATVSRRNLIRAKQRQRQSKRLGMEVLEFRAMLATLWVDNTPGILGTEFTASGGGSQPASVTGLTPGTDIFTTIQSAVNAASSGDTINVSDGTYAENLVLNKELKLLGAQANVATTGVARAGGETTLAGTGTTSSFVLTVQADNVTVNGLEITPRLFARDGINVLTGSVAKPGDPTIGGYRTNIDLVNNWIHSDAGPITQRNGIVFGEHTSNANVSINGQIEDVQITGNYIDIPTLSSSSAASGRAIIFTNQFRDSAPVTPPYSGPTIKFTDFTIDGNTIAGSSSGINATAAPATFKFESPVITGNTFQNSSTGFNSGNLYNADFSENTFQNNRLNAIVGLIGGSLSRNTFGSSVTGDNYALQLWGPEFNYPVGSENFTIENNFFTYGGFASGSVNASGILLRTGVLSDTIAIRDNSFTNLGLNASARAIVNIGLGTANASGNWWGTTSETAVAALMSGPVDFTPFLNSGTDTSGATGFQGDFSTPVDFGDAPATYGTLLAGNGAHHAATGLTLGATRDIEADGQPNAAANGDGADEDGVTISPIVAFGTTTVVANVTGGPGLLDAWIDWNHDGDFADVGEQIATSFAVVNGANQINVPVPAAAAVAAPTTTYARFRLSTVGGLSTTGLALDGEVEDYAVTLNPQLATVYVDPAYTTVGADPDGAGPATSFGYDAFATISLGLPVVAAGGTLVVNAGTYVENVIINKNLTIDGAGTAATTIQGNVSTTGALASVTLREFHVTTGGISVPGGASVTTLNLFDVGGGVGNSIAGTVTTLNLTTTDAADTVNFSGIGAGGTLSTNKLASTAFGAASIGTLNIATFQTAADVSDSITIAPDETTVVNVSAGNPVLPTIGDLLTLNLTGIAPPLVVSATTDGSFSVPGRAAVNWLSIEDVDIIGVPLIPNINIGDVYAMGTPGNDLIILSRGPAPTQIKVRIGGFQTPALSPTGKVVVQGGDGNDSINASNLPLPVEIFGQGGDDYISGAMANDLLVGGIGNDRINGSGGNNTLWGDNEGEQDLVAGGNDQLSALGGNDVFYGGGGNDSVSAGAGSDYAYGGEGNDSLAGSDGDDRMYGGAGDDLLAGGAGNDLLSGGGGVDTLIGDTGNDVLFGGIGADTLIGGDQNDLLVAGSVANELSSAVGDSNDTALLALLATWGGSGSNRTGLAAITHGTDVDSLSGGTGDDDFSFVLGTDLGSDFNTFGMGTDEQF